MNRLSILNSSKLYKNVSTSTISNRIIINNIDNNNVLATRTNIFSTSINNDSSNYSTQRPSSKREAKSIFTESLNNNNNNNDNYNSSDSNSNTNSGQGSANNSGQGSNSGNFGNFGQPFKVQVVQSRFRRVLTLVVGAAVIYYFFFSKGNKDKGGIVSILTDKPFKNVVERPKTTFNDVIGADEAKSELQDLVDFLRQPEKYFMKGIVIPKGILLVGPPGTGKTLLAKSLAGEAQVSFLSINGSEFEEAFVGVGARRVRDLFQTARKNAPCIVFIDEIDSVGGSRSKRVNYHPSEALNQLLVELDGFSGREGVMVIAATNYQETLDAALIRSGRFDRIIQVPLPDGKVRKNIIDHYLKGKPISPSVNTTTIAQSTPGFSGADLFNLVNWAALDTTKNNLPQITMESLENAKENLIMGKERHSYIMSDDARKICAYHEAGHALVAILTPGARTVHKATIMPRGDALGLVSMLEKEEAFVTKKQLLAQMDVAMGGRAAEEIILGKENISQGASSDIQKATQIAKSMVSKYGMSDKVGNIYIQSESKLSPAQRDLVDSEIKQLLDDSYSRAQSLLKKHSKEHHLIAKALLEYETLSLEEIQDIINSKSLVNKKNREQLIQEREEQKKKREENFKNQSSIFRTPSRSNSQSTGMPLGLFSSLSKEERQQIIKDEKERRELEEKIKQDLINFRNRRNQNQNQNNNNNNDNNNNINNSNNNNNINNNNNNDSNKSNIPIDIKSDDIKINIETANNNNNNNNDSNNNK